MKIDRNKLIFVVDDDKSFNALISQYLLTIGFKNVKSYYSGEDAVKAIGLKPDIVMQDYDLPGINGVNVLEEFKKVNPKTEFIFLSGQSSIDVAVEAIQKGAYDYIVKDTFARENTKNKITKVLTIDSLKKNKFAFKIAAFAFIGLFILSWIFFFLFYY